MKTRFVILHYHIFKNGGSTLEWSLKAAFGAGLHRLAAPTGELFSLAEIMNYLSKHPDLIVLSSHHIRYPRPPDSEFKFIDLCFLRHPLDRIVSMYHYYRTLNQTSENIVRQAQQSDLSSFVEYLLETEPFNIINMQTCFFASYGDYFFPPNEKHFEIAVQHVQDVRGLGLVEYFDESLVCLEFFLRPIFPTIDLSYIPQNVTRSAEFSLQLRLESMETAVGSTLFNELKRLNQFDERLWEVARTELEQRIAHIPNFEAKLVAFKQRCQILRSGYSAD